MSTGSAISSRWIFQTPVFIVGAMMPILIVLLRSVLSTIMITQEGSEWQVSNQWNSLSASMYIKPYRSSWFWPYSKGFILNSPNHTREATEGPQILLWTRYVSCQEISDLHPQPDNFPNMDISTIKTSPKPHQPPTWHLELHKTSNNNTQIGAFSAKVFLTTNLQWLAV